MEDYLTVQALAQKFGVSEQSIRLWIKKGSLKAIKIGRGVRIPRESVETFLAAGGKKS